MYVKDDAVCVGGGRTVTKETPPLSPCPLFSPLENKALNVYSDTHIHTLSVID